MILVFIIFQYLIQAVVDLTDKFLISTRKIEPVNYTFYTVATGLILLIAWPFSYAHIPNIFIIWNLASGILFSLAMYVFFRALAQGEASRVVPFVFALVPIFDVIISIFTGKNLLTITEFSAIFLLVPGALLVSYEKGKIWGKHVLLKACSAFLFSSYYALWQYSSQMGPVLNNLMWNRLGAAIILILLLIVPSYRAKVFSFKNVQNKKSTSALFLFKQVLGGLNFIFLSFLIALGNISIINSLQGVRYVFVLILSFILSKTRNHLIAETHNKTIIMQKTFGIIFIFIGTLLLFI